MIIFANKGEFVGDWNWQLVTSPDKKLFMIVICCGILLLILGIVIIILEAKERNQDKDKQPQLPDFW